MKTQLHTIIYFVELFIFLLFSVFLFTHRKGNTLSNRIFAGFLIAKAFISIGVLCYFNRYSVYPSYPWLYIVLPPFYFLVAPFLYLYTRSVLYRDFRVKPAHLLHAIPFVLDVILKATLFLQTPDARNLLMANGGLIPPGFSAIHSLIIDIQVFVYLGSALYQLHRYRSVIKEIYSSTERIYLSWLKLVLIGFVVTQSFYLYKHVSEILIGSYIQSLTIWMHLAELVIVSVIFYQCLRWPEVFSEVNHKRKYEKSPLSESDKQKYLTKLKAYMASEKPYLNPAITLYDLARKIAVQPYYLSQILNTCLNQNFFDFINAYRIEESKKLLSDKSNGKKTILEILYETGFNSKSVFNTAFKKHTGMTPTQFRNANP